MQPLRLAFNYQIQTRQAKPDTKMQTFTASIKKSTTFQNAFQKATAFSHTGDGERLVDKQNARLHEPNNAFHLHRDRANPLADAAGLVELRPEALELLLHGRRERRSAGGEAAEAGGWGQGEDLPAVEGAEESGSVEGEGAVAEEVVRRAADGGDGGAE